MASSNDTRHIQTNNLAVTPQPMTAALIFRRQLVRPSLLKLTANSTADKLPLEKFHRLLDLAFWVKFLKFNNISCFVFLWDVYRVSPGITGYHRVSPGITGYHRVSLAPVACGALNLKCAAGGGKGHNQLTPPRPTISDR
jgi:hypothetical protein